MENNPMGISDPNILLSVINMKLRDQYGSLDILCDDLELSKDDIINILINIGYKYDEEENQFKN
ncbi:DUF4250 domain-containing protein [Clostridium beijerinckii]|uniref:DUF4250 domain-containing protein n=2 Tax=Clostridium beijerinckii TaxID=1520 RepID=A0A1S8RTP8_CLOBE|nr:MULTISPECIES: DUF4250 domain-containing protein [Clostridium]MBA8937602.1 hypothetical protein [Clostridium beijerinckii]MBN7572852.1 DUF4250 domain-containing protein [Clostridium beijerinckii]MBN7578346.1 DUF4250 domain-containing protein [Clostridium beijerinckii]MBN7582626.1 DUF4250 domain-containing protein [Clostridium beijerinckii]MBO0521948.1 DUF4250 domain-containing protein [Clostridium beijerinckii]